MTEPRRDGAPSESTDRDEPASSDDDGETGFAFSRRGLLQAGGSLGVASGLTGCMGLGNVTSYEFNAIPATLTTERETPAFFLDRLSELTVERTRNVVGVNVDVELTNQFALYTGDSGPLGLLSTPKAKVANKKRNPLATDPLKQILVGNAGDRIMQALDLTDKSSVQWTQGPTTVATGQGTLLGQSTDIKAFAGVAKEFGFVLLTAARQTQGSDAVIATTIEQRDGQASTLVGSNGYVTQGTVTDSVSQLKAVLPRVERSGAGIELVESARIVSQGSEPNYVRVRAKNLYEDRTLFSVSMTAQLFDDKGNFLDHRTAKLSRLGPDEQFEGYLPYEVDSVAGYAVDANHARREISAESADSVDIKGHSRDGDTVTARIENVLNQQIPFVSLEVTFYDDDGLVLTTNQRNVADMAPGERRELEVVYVPPAFESPATIGSYSVDVIEYAGSIRYVR